MTRSSSLSILLMSTFASTRSLTLLSHDITNLRVVLASASPRRRELLSLTGLREGVHFEVSPSTFAEDLAKSDFASPAEYTLATATAKAREVAGRCLRGRGGIAHLVIGADTTVEHEGTVLEKPGDAAGAAVMLGKLAGSTHRVHTGVCIFAEPYDAPAAAFVETTVVRFADIGESDIAAYIESGEPMDKAGAYGIQGTAAQFVSGLEGDYFNVVGLPVHRLSTTLAELLRSGVVIC